MFRNYLKTAFRNLWKNKAFSVINVMGLALGLACSLLIMLWVNDEYKIDAFHRNSSRLYSVYERQYREGQVNAFHGTPGILADELKRVMPEVQYATNYAWNELSTIEANGKIIKKDRNYAGPDFFKMFTYLLLEGSVTTVLQSPLDIAISKKMAEEFFGSPAKAIGKSGIRKVLVASPASLFTLLSKEFLLLVLIAMVIASPIAWINMYDWLQDYAYKINISWWMFVIAGVVAIFIALVTVSFQAVKAAISNPVKSLRTE